MNVKFPSRPSPTFFFRSLSCSLGFFSVGFSTWTRTVTMVMSSVSRHATFSTVAVSFPGNTFSISCVKFRLCLKPLSSLESLHLAFNLSTTSNKLPENKDFETCRPPIIPLFIWFWSISFASFSVLFVETFKKARTLPGFSSITWTLALTFFALKKFSIVCVTFSAKAMRKGLDLFSNSFFQAMSLNSIATWNVTFGTTTCVGATVDDVTVVEEGVAAVVIAVFKEKVCVVVVPANNRNQNWSRR